MDHASILGMPLDAVRFNRKQQKAGQRDERSRLHWMDFVDRGIHV